ncbi:hypothetical protein [Flavobacterium artemisiae]
MFKRRFKDQFDFSENPLFSKFKYETTKFDRYIYVLHDKFELLEFLKIEQNKANVLVCLFDKQLYSSLLSFEEIKNLILVDSSKTRTEIIKDLKTYFKRKSDDSSQLIRRTISDSALLQSKFQDNYKAMFFLM